MPARTLLDRLVRDTRQDAGGRLWKLVQELGDVLHTAKARMPLESRNSPLWSMPVDFGPRTAQKRGSLLLSLSFISWRFTL